MLQKGRTIDTLDMELYLEYIKTKDNACVEKLIARHEDLIQKVVDACILDMGEEYAPLRADMMQEARIGVIRGINHLNLDKVTKFIGYVYWWIRQSVYSFIYSEGEIRYPNIYKEEKMKFCSLYTLNLECKGEEFYPIENQVKAMITKEVDDTCKRVLSPKENRIIKDRFGFGASGEHKSLEKIGEELGITRERVRQIQNKALSKMNEPMMDIKSLLEDAPYLQN